MLVGSSESNAQLTSLLPCVVDCAFCSSKDKSRDRDSKQDSRSSGRKLSLICECIRSPACDQQHSEPEQFGPMLAAPPIMSCRRHARCQIVKLGMLRAY
jgi:hypothetical protein